MKQRTFLGLLFTIMISSAACSSSSGGGSGGAGGSTGSTTSGTAGGTTTGTTTGGTGGGSGIDCAGTSGATFPTFDKTCTMDADCVVKFHQVDCCGTRKAIGVSMAASAAFDAAEMICDMQYPGCGCASQPTVAEDGKTSPTGDSGIKVMCGKGTCFTYVP